MQLTQSQCFYADNDRITGRKFLRRCCQSCGGEGEGGEGEGGGGGGSGDTFRRLCSFIIDTKQAGSFGFVPSGFVSDDKDDWNFTIKAGQSLLLLLLLLLV